MSSLFTRIIIKDNVRRILKKPGLKKQVVEKQVVEKKIDWTTPKKKRLGLKRTWISK